MVAIDVEDSQSRGNQNIEEIYEGLEPLALSSYEKEAPKIEEINDSIKDELLMPSNQLSWDLLDLVQTYPEVDKDKIFEKLLLNPKTINRVSTRFKRSGISGEINGYKEELKYDLVDNATSGNSLSMNRKFTSKGEALKGKTTFLPFQPGGLLNQNKVETEKKDATFFLHRNEVGLYDIPQGLSRGLSFTPEQPNNEDIVDLDQNAEEQNIDNQDGHLEISQRVFNENIDQGKLEENGDLPFESNEIDGIVPIDYLMLKRNLAQETELKKNWAHVVDLNHRVENFKEVIPNMAREWPFQLDTFQQEAIYHLEQGDSVFVAAHTSAGKTVVAEYAIAMATRNMTKTIYTSPIKALSNQKFRDFKETFKDMDVGLITGDVQINPDANCLIMTTEILRSMLYRGADLIRDVEFVIFDEVHYVNDIDRGVVWEEVIIMLPEHVKYILLSATVPNTFEFANWVGRTKQKDMYVISTPKRPIPLEIFIWAKDDLFKVIDAGRKFKENEFKKHKEILEKGKKKDVPSAVMGSGSRGGPGGSARGGNRGGGRGGNSTGGGMNIRGRGGGRGGSGGRGGGMQRFGGGRSGPNKNTWLNLVQYLQKKNLLPAVIFVFSKKRCEEFADTLSSVNFCTAKERSQVHMFIDTAVSRLKKEDRELPQILKIRDMLSRGIAVHHGGLLPIVKECIEILFAKTLVKVLFATETFAMGLNLPTRTVVFNELRKHDGRGFRNLLPGEFTQMSGRAGRRGLDATGTVIVMSYNDPLSPTDFKEVTLGTPTKLLSQFRLTYNMILNLIRIEALKVEEMIKHSFSENSTQSLLPEHQKTVATLTEQFDKTVTEDSKYGNLESAKEVYRLLNDYEKVYGDIVEEVQKFPVSRHALFKVGRSLCFRDKDGVLRFGFLVKTDFSTNNLMVLTFDHGEAYEKHSREFQLPYLPHRPYLSKWMKPIKYSGGLRVEAVPYKKVNFVSRYMMKARINGVLNNNAETVAEAIEQIRVIIQFQYKLEELGFYQAIQVSLHDMLNKKKEITSSFKNLDAYLDPNFEKQYAHLHEQHSLKSKIDSLQLLISNENLELLPDYEQRLKVLHTLGFIDDNSNVVLKGRVACEINSGWELILTELVLDNFLGDFEPEEIVALLSCFVYEGKSKEDELPLLTPRLEKGKDRIVNITEKLTKIYTDHQVLLTSEESEFTERKRFALVNVVYEWARGLSFNEIMQISPEAEGTIVRVITRLDEICREVKNAALIVGDSTLHSKMGEAQERIKRDIVFCASLYL